MNYSPKKFEGKHFAEIFSEILYSNKTVDNSLVRVLDNIKYSQNITSLSGKIGIQDYAVTPTGGTSTLNFSDATLTPVKKMAYATFTYEDLRNTRFSESMNAGAANVVSDEFDKAVLAHTSKTIAADMEDLYWSTVATKLGAASDTLKVTGTTLTASNLKAEFNKVYNKIPGEILESEDLRIYADRSIFKLVMQANLNETYRDVFTVNGKEHFFLGVKIEYVPLGANKMTAGIKSDYVWGTDLISDMANIEINKVANNSDEYFIKAVFTLDGDVCIKAQKVLYA